MNAVVLVLLALLSVVGIPLWGELPPLPRIRLAPAVIVAGGVGLLATAAVLAWATGPGHGHAGRAVTVLAAVLGVGASVLAGGPVVVAVLRLADSTQPRGGTGPADPRVLTGGAWIGTLERLAVTASLLIGRPEGMVVVVAVKGLGRYPELRAPAAAERFIIGTLASLLWAAGCAGVALALRQ